MKRIFAILAVISLILTACGVRSNSSQANADSATESATSTITETEITEEETTAPKETEENEEKSTETSEAVKEETQPQTEEKKDNISLGMKNALESAKGYLKFAAFSYSGLIEQLEFEGYTNEEAVYAVDNCGADWNEQAAKCAESYMSFSSFSRQSLIEQLKFEGFTDEQAEYGASAVGY